MSFEDRIREAYPTMSKSFLKLADFMLDSYIQASFMTATELAHTLDVDTTTVVRFSQLLGYSGYPPLLREIRAKVKAQIILQPDQAAPAGSTIAIVDTAMQNLGEVLRRAYMLLDETALETLVERLGTARRIFITSDSIAQAAAYTLINLLERGGFPVIPVQNSAPDLARALRLLTPQDLLLALEVVGDLPYVARALLEAEARHIPTAAIVSAASFEAARASSLVLVTQTQPSSEFNMVLMNAIIYALGKVLRWKYPARFAGADQEITALSARLYQPQASPH